MRKAFNRTVLPSPRNKQEDNLECGLRALAEMIATAYRRRITGETDTALFSSKNGDETPSVEAKIMRYAEPEDLRCEGEYTETVKIENFLRRKIPQVKNSGGHKMDKVNE